MGANFNSRTYVGLDKATIEKKWESAVMQSRHEDGHSYSGEIGMLGLGIHWTTVEVADADAAEEYLEEHQEKWSQAMAVFYKKGDKVVWVVGGWCSS